MNALKIVVVALCVASALFGLMLNTNNKQMAETSANNNNPKLTYPPAAEFKTASTSAFVTAGFAAVLAILLFMNNRKMLVAFALFTIVSLILSYYLQPEYAKVQNGPATSKELGLIQLFTGNVAAFGAIIFARGQGKEQL